MLYTTRFSRFKTIGDGSAGTARTFENNTAVGESKPDAQLASSLAVARCETMRTGWIAYATSDGTGLR